MIVHGIADHAFKGLNTFEDVLQVRPSNGRESWTLQWNESFANLPFFCMASPDGPQKKGLTLSSFHHTLINLARRDGYKDRVDTKEVQLDLYFPLRYCR